MVMCGKSEENERENSKRGTKMMRNKQEGCNQVGYKEKY